MTPITSTQQLSSVFKQLKPHIELALTKAPEYTLESVLEDVLRGQSLLWYAHEEDTVYGIVTTQIKQYPQIKVIVGHLVGGTDINKWVHLMSTIEDYAKEQGCTDVELQARKGWLKVMPEYTAERLILTKKL